MKIQSLSLLAAAVLACAACKNNAEAPGATTDTSAPAPSSEQAPTAGTPVVDSATAAEATAATAPAADAATTAASATASHGWSYEGSDGAKRTASVSGHGSDGGSAQLVFADDPVWGRTAYVEFVQDGIDCPTGCKAQISVDGGAAKTVQASRPETPQPRLSLREPDKLWQSIASAKTLSIEFPAKSGTGKIEFDVTGVDTSKLPADWN